jgi:tRNA 2-thiocytidine biosynthesis protein TtcA
MDAIRVILACIRKADDKFNLINNGDKICLGISGGKDSMSMLYALDKYKKFSKTKFEIYPVMIDLGFDNFNPKVTKEFAEKLGYNLKIVEAKTVYEILKIQKEKQHTPNLPCSICSKMKKAVINKAAHELGCNKVAFAHHRDDAIETLLLNEIYGGRMATFSPKMFLTGEKITFIRPLVLAKEADIKRLCEEEKIPISSSHCPNDKYTEREEIKKILHDIYLKYPSSKENFLNMMMNDTKEDLFYSHVENKIEGTNYYFKKILTINEFLNEISFNKNKVIKNEQNLLHYDLFDYKNKIRATILLEENIENRTFIIKDFKYLKIEEFSLFLKEIINMYYEKYNPCTLMMHFKSTEKLLVEKFGFKKEDKFYKIEIINRI